MKSSSFKLPKRVTSSSNIKKLNIDIEENLSEYVVSSS